MHETILGPRRNRLHASRHSAEAHTLAGDRKQALAELSTAVVGHEFFTAFMGAEPAFRDLHADPVFEALLKQVGLPASRRQ